MIVENCMDCNWCKDWLNKTICKYYDREILDMEVFPIWCELKEVYSHNMTGDRK